MKPRSLTWSHRDVERTPEGWQVTAIDAMKLRMVGNPERVVQRDDEAHYIKMDDRLKKAELAIAGIKPTLDNIGLLLSRLDATLTRLDQRMVGVETGQAGLNEKISRVATRLGSVETAVNSAVKDAISRVPSWWQIPMAITATVLGVGGALAMLAGAVGWLRQHSLLTL